MIFDGKKEAEKIAGELLASGRLNGKSLVILSSQPNSVYVRLKKEMGERLGVKVKVEVLRDKDEVRRKLEETIVENGVLVQLPIVGADVVETQKILDLIPREKDVDGLNSRSDFRPAAVKAVIKILRIAEVEKDRKVCVVGSEGMVGRRLVKWLKTRALEVGEFDLGSDLTKLVDFEVVIGATGRGGLIKPEMVREGVVAIDLGFPKGDFAPAVAGKASFFTPVPGGVGPLTIVSLFENLARS